MPSLRDIQRRIRSVEKTQQITSAMRMVAAAKLRRAQDLIIAARPYAEKMYATLAEIGRREGGGEHVLLEPRETKRVLELVVVTSDRGLCGAFNASAIKHAESVLRGHGKEFERVIVTPVGRKALEYFRKRGKTGEAKWVGIPNIEVRHATAIAEHLSERFVGGEIDEARIVYNEFKSALTQTPRNDRLLPLAQEPEAEADASDAPYEIEPDAKSLLDLLLPRALEFSIYRALLENQAGEHAARMTAMESATRNTEDLIKSLTLQFNRARQAAITKELVEIVTGAQALSG